MHTQKELLILGSAMKRELGKGLQRAGGRAQQVLFRPPCNLHRIIIEI